jgi:hypothetical protein
MILAARAIGAKLSALLMFGSISGKIPVNVIITEVSTIMIKGIRQRFSTSCKILTSKPG